MCWNEVMLLSEKFPWLEDIYLSSCIFRDIVNDLSDKHNSHPKTSTWNKVSFLPKVQQNETFVEPGICSERTGFRFLKSSSPI